MGEIEIKRGKALKEPRKALNKRGQSNTLAGESHHNARLTEQLVRELRQMVADGICVCCAQKFLKLECSYSTAWDAANYTTWRHVKD